jgi:hypothetical protein
MRFIVTPRLEIDAAAVKSRQRGSPAFVMET